MNVYEEKSLLIDLIIHLDEFEYANIENTNLIRRIARFAKLRFKEVKLK